MGRLVAAGACGRAPGRQQGAGEARRKGRGRRAERGGIASVGGLDPDGHERAAPPPRRVTSCRWQELGGRNEMWMRVSQT